MGEAERGPVRACFRAQRFLEAQRVLPGPIDSPGKGPWLGGAVAEGTVSVDRRSLTLGPLMGARGATCWPGCRVWEGRRGVTWAGQW